MAYIGCPARAGEHRDPSPRPPRRVMAAASGAALDDLGLPLPAPPQPVRLTRGKAPEHWTKQERDAAHQWQLGPAFRAGLKPPPGGADWYIPGPGDHSFYDPASREWLPKQPW